MNDRLMKLVKQAAQDQPAWLQKKRQLALLMVNQLSCDEWQQKLVNSWQQQPDLTIVNEEVASQQDAFVDLPLFVAAHRYPELLQENLMEKAISWQDNVVNALHLAFINGGRFIYVPDGHNVEEPIELTTSYSQPNYHNLVIVGANAEVTIIEHEKAVGNQPAFTGTELLLGDGAHVNYYQSNQFSANDNREVVRAYQARNSTLQLYAALFDHHSMYGDIYTNLDGDGSNADFKMVGIATGQQVQEINTKIENHGLHTDGLIQQNGVINDKAVLNFHAVGKIFKGAHQSSSNQESRLLTLTSASHGEADPVLLIEDNDVDAGHAASIGRVDKDQLYYLQSRGLSLLKAQILLTRGFLLPVIEKFPDKKLRQQTIDELLQRLKVKE